MIPESYKMRSKFSILITIPKLLFKTTLNRADVIKIILYTIEQNKQ